MDPFGNDEIARLLRLKRYEQPPPAYFENFLSEFRRRQRDELLRQPPWRIWFERAQGFTVRHNVRSLASYAAGIAAAVACVAVISIRIYQQPDTNQVRSPELARPKHVTKYRKRTEPCASGDFRVSTWSRLFSPEAGMFRCCRLTYSGPMSLSHSSSNGNRSTISHCQRNKS